MEEGRFRKKITWFTFAFSLFVVWVHSYNAELFLGRTEAGVWTDRIEHLIGESVGQIAVPGFFMISAYLFYRNFHWGILNRKWISRFHSILVPYLLWNTIYYLGYVVGSRLPFVGRIVGKGQIPLSISHYLDSVLHFRYLYVFWYLKQLIFLILLAPVLYLVLKRFWSGLLFLAAVFCAVWVAADFPLINEDALFYYGTGGFLALHGHQMERAWSRERFAAGLGLLAAGIGNYYLTLRWFLPGTTVLYRMLVPMGLWLMIDENRLPRLRPWMEYNFFLYAVHFALVRFLNKTAAFLARAFLAPSSAARSSVVIPSAMLPLALYLVMPFLMAAVSYWMALLLRRFAPGLWRVLNGRR